MTKESKTKTRNEGKFIRAAFLSAQGLKNKEIAKKLGISESILYIWMREPDWEKLVKYYYVTFLKKTAAKIGNIADLALETIEKVLKNGKIKDWGKLQWCELALIHWQQVKADIENLRKEDGKFGFGNSGATTVIDLVASEIEPESLIEEMAGKPGTENPNDLGRENKTMGKASRDSGGNS